MRPFFLFLAHTELGPTSGVCACSSLYLDHHPPGLCLASSLSVRLLGSDVTSSEKPSQSI